MVARDPTEREPVAREPTEREPVARDPAERVARDLPPEAAERDPLERDGDCFVATGGQRYSPGVTRSGNPLRDALQPITTQRHERATERSQASITTGTIIGRRLVCSDTKPPAARRTAFSIFLCSKPSSSAFSVDSRT